jgi:hypothetical protein
VSDQRQGSGALDVEIDALCNVAQRIIGKLKEGAAAGGLPYSALPSAKTQQTIRQRLQ